MNNSPGTEQESETLVALTGYPLADKDFLDQCKATLDQDGVLVLPDFLTARTIESIRNEGNENQHLAFYTSGSHSVYLTPPNPDYSDSHPANRQVRSSKGCITTDQIPLQSPLHQLYHNALFKRFLCSVLAEKSLHEYADPLSSINLHYAAAGQELGWHYDNSSFAITLLIQKPQAGAEFQFVKDVRNADQGDMAYEETAEILDGHVAAIGLSMEEGALVLFRGQNSIHRVTPTEGEITRMLVVLAYNSEPGVELSESARKTFYGRLG